MSKQGGQDISIYLVLLVFCSIFAGVGLYGTVSGYLDNRAAQAWPTTPGEIIRSEPALDSDDSADIDYRYHVGGADYEGHRISYLGARNSDQDTAEYPVGKKVTVHYDPDNPAQAALRTDEYGGALIALFFALIGGLGLVATLGAGGVKLKERSSWEPFFAPVSAVVAAFLLGIAGPVLVGLDRPKLLVAFVGVFFLGVPVVMLLVPSLRNRFGAAGCFFPFALLGGMVALEACVTYPVEPLEDRRPVTIHGVQPGMTVAQAEKALWGLDGPLVPTPERLTATVEGGEVLIVLDSKGKVAAVHGPRIHRGRKVILTVGRPLEPRGWEQLGHTAELPRGDFEGSYGTYPDGWLDLKLEKGVVVDVVLKGRRR